MSDSEHKFDEEALRKKIREELKKEHQRRQEEAANSEEKSGVSEDTESEVFEHLLKDQVEEEVFSSYPEFIRCENHLNEVRWLTPLELEEDYEFYPTEESRFEKLKKKFSKRSRVVPDSPEIKEMLEQYREDLQAEAKERVSRYHEFVDQKVQTSKKSQQSEMEARLFEEEQDRFYRDLKGYKKYKNHAGETRWLTREEFESQDEFIDEVLTLKQLLFRRIGWSLAIITLIAFGWFLLTLFPSDEKPGYLIVKAESVDAHLYIDQNPAFGFTPNVAYPVPSGQHEIMILRLGFISKPGSQTLTFSSLDTVRMEVEFIPQPTTASALVKINSSVKDAGIYVNGEFRGSLGNNPTINLTPGEYTITLGKEGFLTSPAQRFLSLAEDDTVELNFRLIPTGDRGNQNAGILATTGLIEVTSNVKDADILLNGQSTGFKTDYVLQKVSLGQYIVSVRKEGYEVYPEEKSVRLAKNDKNIRVHFNLSSTSRQVTIQTVPERGEIFIDGKSAGRGKFSGSLPLGEHIITFGELESYQNPGSKKISVSESGEHQFVFYYLTDLNIQFDPSSKPDPEYSGSLTTGHILEGIEFQSNQQVGPEVRPVKDAAGNYWYMNYAYQYRNPPGSDAIAFRFRIPESLQFTKEILLKLWIYKTGDNYPLTLKGRPAYRVIINKGIVVDSAVPENDLNNISEQAHESIPVNEFLKNGYNTIIISTAPDASAAIALWKISLE